MISTNRHNGFFNIVVLVVMALVLVSVGAGVYISKNRGGEIACTQEAKQCPDGSYVGRTGPNCEFEACPESGSTSSSQAELKYKLLAKFPNFFFCDPDFYPVGRGDEEEKARTLIQDFEKNTEFRIIAEHVGLSGKTSFTTGEALLIYRGYKKLRALPLEAKSAEIYEFHVHTGDEGGGERINGTIDAKGNITILKREPTFNTCPICTT